MSTDFTAKIANNTSNLIISKTSSTVTITGTDIKINDIKKILYTTDSGDLYISVNFNEGTRNCWEKVSVEKNKIVLKTITGGYYQVSRTLTGEGQDIIIRGAIEDITQGTATSTYTSSFPLTEIDDLREYILSKGREQIRIGKDSDAKLKSLFIYKILYSPNPDKAGTVANIPPIAALEMGGLCLKTHQSDLFNNWVNKEWVEGVS